MHTSTTYLKASGYVGLLQFSGFNIRSHAIRVKCCCRMLKFIHCIRNKLPGSSDVGFGRDGVMDVVGHYCDRK